MENVGGQNVSRETLSDLRAFEELVRKWNPKINLVSKASLDDLWNRHIVDSAQLYELAPDTYRSWVDIGSGGGFPGIVLAIIAKAKQPNAIFTLIEADQRKAAFLRNAARELSLSVNVLAERIEEAAPQAADVVSARALTALSGLLPFINRHLHPGGVALLHKGQRFQAEIDDARRSWHFDLRVDPSMTDPNARLLSIQRIHHDPVTQA